MSKLESSDKLIDGRQSAQNWLAQTKKRAENFKTRTGRKPHLDVLIVGDDPASQTYVRAKAKRAAENHIGGSVVPFPASITSERLFAEIEQRKQDPLIDGILLQLPLPSHLSSSDLLASIQPEKDVDGFHPVNVGKLSLASRDELDGLLLPCTPHGCVRLLQEHFGPSGLAGQEGLILGRSNIVGKPLATLLLAHDMTVTVAHSRTRDLADVISRHPIVVVAIGRPGVINSSWFQRNSVVIDVGINRVTNADGRRILVGDVELQSALERVRAITPVPGGVGPMTVAGLLHNTVCAAENRFP